MRWLTCPDSGEFHNYPESANETRRGLAPAEKWGQTYPTASRHRLSPTSNLTLAPAHRIGHHDHTMRLIKTDSLELVEFVGRVPPYVILSHTWGHDELTCQDLLTASSRAIAKKKVGFAKIAGCCARAVEDGYEYAWVDTCCIDKASSAELSEAINSMYQWYQDAHICYAYMTDVSIDSAAQVAVSTTSADASAARKRASEPPAKPLLHTIPSILREYDSLPRTFENSRWFTRGWTLQELIAPPLVEFYAQDWKEIGTKFSLRRAISRITGIDIRVLEGADPSTCTVAERMSWAASRETTRVEDKAYCLLGIFKVNMPLIYGEGPRAFSRLQKEIMKTTEDYTMLAWGLSKYLSNKHHWRGIPGAGSHDQRRPLADSPNDFEVHNRSQWTYANLIPDPFTNNPNSKSKTPGAPNHDDTPPLITSRGLRVTLLTRFNPKTCDVQAYINCKTPNPSNSHPTPVPVCLILHRHPSTNIYTGSSDPNAAFFLLDNTTTLSNFERRTIYISTQTAEGDATGQNHRATSLERNLYVLDRPPLLRAGDPVSKAWKITSCFSHAVGAGQGHAHFEVPRRFIPAQLYHPFDLPPSTVRMFAFERGTAAETFAVVVGGGWCSVVGLMEEGFRERWGVLVEEGRWDDKAALRFICYAAERDGDLEGEGEEGPVDRVKRRVGDVNVSVSLKKVRKGDVGCESAVKIVWAVG